MLPGYLPSWLTAGKAQQQGSDFCSTRFPELWSSFVDHWVDYSFTGGCTAGPQQELTTSVLPAVERLVAIGDLHGDYDKARAAFRLAGLTDKTDRWIGRNTTCVQVGDILDRGDGELKILYLLERLKQEAAQAGCHLHVLNGNHETMNVMGDFRYATSGATDALREWHQLQRVGSGLKSKCGCSAGWDKYRAGFQQAAAWLDRRADNPWRTGALAPGKCASLVLETSNSWQERKHGTQLFACLVKLLAAQTQRRDYWGGPVTSRFLLGNPTVLQVGSTVFVHGGILPHHVEYGLDRINRETAERMAGGGETGQARRPPDFLRGVSAIVWARDYSAEDQARCDCDKLQAVLAAIPGAARMVVGHTIQRGGINAACGGQVIRVDVGMSQGCGDRDVEVLEIMQDGAQVRRLRQQAPPQELPGKPSSVGCELPVQAQRRAVAALSPS